MNTFPTAWEGYAKGFCGTLPAATRANAGFAGFGESASSLELPMHARHHDARHAQQVAGIHGISAFPSPYPITTNTLTKSWKAFVYAAYSGEGCSRNPSQPSPKDQPC